MADDPTLEYLKSIDERTARIEGKLDGHADRLSSLEETRAKQRGVMAAGGAAVTMFSGLASWIGRH